MPRASVHDITAAKVPPCEGGAASKTERNRRGTLRAFLNYSVGKKWMRELPHIADEDFKRPDPEAIGHVTVEQADGVMRRIEKHTPRFAAWFALRRFAGFGNAEAGRPECPHRLRLTRSYPGPGDDGTPPRRPTRPRRAGRRSTAPARR